MCDFILLGHETLMVLDDRCEWLTVPCRIILVTEFGQKNSFSRSTDHTRIQDCQVNILTQVKL